MKNIRIMDIVEFFLRPSQSGIFHKQKESSTYCSKLGLQVTSYTHKSRKYSSYKGRVGTVAPNRIHRRFNTHIPHQKITTDTSEFKYYEVDEKGRMTIHALSRSIHGYVQWRNT